MDSPSSLMSKMPESLHVSTSKKLCYCLPADHVCWLLWGHVVIALSFVPIKLIDIPSCVAELLSGRMMAWTTSSISGGVWIQTCWSSYLPTAMSGSASLMAERFTLTPVPSSRPFLNRVSHTPKAHQEQLHQLNMVLKVPKHYLWLVSMA